METNMIRKGTFRLRTLCGTFQETFSLWSPKSLYMKFTQTLQGVIS